MPEPSEFKTVLVFPSQHQGVRSLFTFHKNKGLGAKPPLAIISLASYLIQNGFYKTECLDAPLDDLSPEETVHRLVGMKPDIVGMTVWTDFWYPAWKTVQGLKKALPQIKIVLGGPHATIYPRESLEYSEADYVVAGEGEGSLLELVKGLSQGRDIEPQPGLWVKTPDGINQPTDMLAVVEELDSLPIPDRSLLPYRRYNSVLNPNQFETTMITSRGCPHKCVFCKMFSQRVHARSAESVVEELRRIEAMGIQDIQVYDDTFTWSKQRVMDICTGILDNKLNVRWAIRDRVNKADQEMYRLMKRAGCYRIHFGVESGSERILAASGKGITIPQVRQAVAMAREVGFETLTYYMFGFIDETPKDAQATLRLALQLNTDYAVFAVLIPYPGTAIYEQAIERDIIDHDFWLDFTRRPMPEFRVPGLIEHHMDREGLIQLKNQAQKRYYLRPRRILKEVQGLRSLTEFRNKVGMSLNLLSDYVRRR